MSIVKNEAKYKNPLLAAIREQLEHRAYWLYLLCDEAGKRGLDWKEFGEPAIRRCGLDHGMRHVKKGNTDSLKGLYTTFSLKDFVSRRLFLNVTYRLSSRNYTHNMMYGIGWRFGRS